jgi:hypothetical protein
MAFEYKSDYDASEKVDVQNIILSPCKGHPCCDKIQAIKAVRDLTGYGLKDSKAIVDAVFNGHVQSFKNREVMYHFDRNIETLKACNINVIFADSFEQKIRPMLKECVNLCLEYDEAEMLEVLAVAFKMCTPK